MAKLQITYTKSAIGYSKDQKATIESLGLRKLNSAVVHDDTPAIRGMAFKVRHLVTVSEIGEDQPAKPKAKAKTTVTKASAEPAPRRKSTPAASTRVDAPAKADLVAEADAPAAKADAPAKAEAQASAKAKPHAADDLEAIEGIGPKIAGVLKAAGITNFAELAAADASQLNEILQGANLRLADPTTWPEQAQLAADGKWDEFKELQNSLKGGRRE